MDNEVVLRDFLKATGKNFIKNNKVLRRRLSMNRGQLKKAICVLVNKKVLIVYQRSTSRVVYKVNRDKLPINYVPSSTTEKATQKLKTHLVGKTQLKNISAVRNELQLGYSPMRKAINELINQGVLTIKSESSHYHRVFVVNLH